MNEKHFLLFFLLLLFLNSVPLSAQTAYVNDRLFLGVYAQPSSEQSAIHTLSSGSTVEVLEKQETFTKIRTATGVEGWVRTRFISEDKPASVRVKEVEAERDRLNTELKQAPTNKEINTLKSQLQVARRKITSLENKANSSSVQVDTQQIDTLKAQLEASQIKVTDFEKEVATLKAKAAEEKPQEPIKTSKHYTELSAVPWYWILLTIILLFISGFVFGVTLLARRVRNRFNGIKVW